MLATSPSILTAAILRMAISRVAIGLATAAITLSPMLIDTAEAVEVIGPGEVPGNRPVANPGPSPESFILGSRSFSIPFTVDPTADGPVEVHLFAAQADGASTEWKWIEAKRSGDSAAQEFQFTADQDGEFWFATWTTKAAPGNTAAKPKVGDIQAQRKIYVDTTKPVIDLSAESDGAGNVLVRTKISDVTAVSDLVLRYVTDQMQDWQTLDAGPLSRNGKTGSRNGKMSFQPSGDWEQLSVQIIATDKAGNQSVGDHLVRRPRLATVSPQQPVSSQLQSSQQPGPRYADSTLAPWSGQSVPYRRQYTTSSDLKTRVPENLLPPPATPDQIGSGFGLTSPQRPPANQPETLPAPKPAPDPNTSSPPNPRPGLNKAQERTKELKKYRSRSLKEAMRPLSKESRVPMKKADSQPKSPRNLSRRPTVPPTSRVPVRYSDRERFSLDYVLEAVDSQGVEAVELYGSVDEGTTWKLWGRDPDRRSPFDIETREEGVFSYRIVVVGRSGLASARPLAGDLPDMVVVVDKKAPEVRISGARYGEGDRIGALVIRYECVDPNLMDRPITLAFSENIDGPWTTIAGGLRNDGDYVWPADPGLPRAFYLRIDATDKAGNVGTYLLDKPIDAQGLAPRARIRGFQTLSGL